MIRALTAGVSRQDKQPLEETHMCKQLMEEIQHQKTQQALACQGSQRHAFSTRSAMSSLDKRISVKASDSIAQSLM